MGDTTLQVATPSTLVRQSFEPTTLQEAMEFSKILSESDLVPKDFKGKPANVLVAIQYGKELGIPPLQALQGIAVINSRATVWGDLMWAIVTNHPDFEDHQETITDTSATIILKRRKRSAVTVTFTKADAEKAGLWGKAGPWTQYPKRQMQWRARTFAARDLFPDALKGMISAEEAQDYPGETIEGQTATTQVPPVATATEKQEETIGQTGGSEFYRFYKASGWTPEEAKAWLRDTLHIGHPHNDKNSQHIPVSKKEEAFKWAQTKAPIRLAVEEKFALLGWTPEEQTKFFQDRKGVWAEVDKELAAEIAKRDTAERGE